ncbi:cytochrome P450 [Nocardia altamirensis]|uniref:cytochrome P450 n=1 Tax=Nocardia altamirensis TaxID=472158 RepID=UPI000840701E|nr:cytochrome P450 [Nocardia altamirensis]
MSGASSPTVALPHPKDRHPLFGDAKAIDPSRPTQTEYQLAQELGPIYELMFGPDYRLLVVTGTELAQEVWDETRFEKHVAAPLERLREVTGDGLFMAYSSEPVWGIAHRILTPGFVKPAMAIYHDAMVASIESMFEYWQGAGARPRVNLTQDLNSLTFELIGRAGFSTSFSAFAHGGDADLHPFLTQLNRAMWWISTVSNSTPMERVRLERQHGQQYKDDLVALHEYGLELAGTRAAEPRQGSKDLLDLMLTTVDPDTGEKLPAENIAYQVVSFLLAGQETTAGTLGFALHYLMQQPEIADRVRAEVQEVCGDSPIAYEQVAKLRYTRCVVDETLRLWPSAPGYFRAARADTELGGCWPVREGEPIFVLTLGLHRNEDWHDPLTFDPDRFLPGRDKGPYRPFGVGPRACIGRQFALHEAVLTLALATRRYNFVPDSDYTLAVHEQLTLKPENLYATLEHRVS